MGTEVLGLIINVISGMAKMENPNPDNPCNKAEVKKTTLPKIIIPVSISIST
jgi:hypothetical protein